MQSPLGDMDGVGKYFAIGVIGVVGTLYALDRYAGAWESEQQKQPISQAEVVSIEPYFLHNELHGVSSGNRIRIKGEDRVIDFSSEEWDNTVKEGDLVEVVFRKRFPLFGNELDGIRIDDHK